MFEEPQELLVAVPLLAQPGDCAGGDLQGGEQGGGAVSDVVVGEPLGQPRLHRQHRLSAVQRLDLGLLVHAEHDRVLRWRQVQPDDVDDLGFQLGSVENLNVSALQGLTPYSFHTVAMVA